MSLERLATKLVAAALLASCLASLLLNEGSQPSHSRRFERPAPEISDNARLNEDAKLLFYGLAAPGQAGVIRMPLAAMFNAVPAGYGASILAGSVLAALILALSGLAPAAPLLFLANGSELAADAFQMMYAVLVLLTSAALWWRARRPDWRRSLTLAVILGVSILCRSALAFFGPLLAVFELALPSRRGPKPGVKGFLILCVVPYLFLIPWIRFNSVMHSRFIPFENGEAACNIVLGASGFVETTEGSWPILIDDPSVDASDTSSVLAWAIGKVLSRPGPYLLATLKRLGLAALWLNPALLLLAAAAVWRWRRRAGFAQMALFICYFIGAHCLMAVEERYFIPLLPILSIMAGLSLASLFPPSLPGWRRRAALLRLTPRFWAAAGAACLLGASAVEAVVWRAASDYPRAGAQALAKIERALARAPRDQWLRFARAQALEGEGKWPQARLQYAAFAGSPEFGFASARALARRGELAPLSLYIAARSAIRGDGDVEQSEALNLIEALSVRAVTLSRQGRHAQAVADLKEAVRLSRLSTAPLERKLGGPAGASSLKEASVNRYLRTLLRCEYGETREERLAFLKNLAAAAPGAEATQAARAELLRPKKPAALQAPSPPLAATADRLLAGAEAAASAGQPEAARRLLAQAGRLPLGFEQKRSLANLAQRTRDPALAARWQDELIRERPREPSLRLERAALLLAAGNASAARPHLEAALALGADAGQKRRIAQLRIEARDYAGAGALLEQLLRSRPDDAGLLADRGVCLFLAGSPDLAIAELRKALAKDPALSSAALSLGAILSGRREYDAALGVYDAALVSARSTEDRGLLAARRRALRSARP